MIDCDWVPRMSLHSVTRLREEILDAISRARVHKLMILQVSGVASFRRDPLPSRMRVVTSRYATF